METTGRYNAGGPHRGRKFSTYDRDNDEKTVANCAGRYWYGVGDFFDTCKL